MTTLKAELVQRGKEQYAVIEVPSFSNPSKVYRVDAVNQRCSCPAWKFAKSGPNGRSMCKHLIHLGFKPRVSIPENYEEHL